MSGAAYGAGTIKLIGRTGTSGSFLPTIDFGASAGATAHTITIQIRSLSTEGVGGTQCLVDSSAPGTTYAAALTTAGNTLGALMNNYSATYSKDVTGTALWAGWLQPDPASGDPPTAPLMTVVPIIDPDTGDVIGNATTLFPLPGGNTPTPLLGSQAGAVQTAEHTFATITLTIPANAVYPVLFTPDGKLFNQTNDRILDVSMVAFTALPEPVSALLLLAGLPLLRRRR